MSRYDILQDTEAKKIVGRLFMSTNCLQHLPCHWVICAPVTLLSDECLMQKKKLQWLSPFEIQRAERFRRIEDQRRYILAHSMKRFYLSILLRIAPQDLNFDEGDKGKPFCSNHGAPFFNISHSGDWVLFGVSSISEIGLDVESSQRDLSDSVAGYILTAAQLEKVNGLANGTSACMTYWTQKEAVSKALGMGLSIDFKTIECSGQLGVSRVEHSGQVLNLYSQLIDCEYIITLVSFSEKPLLIYKLYDWSQGEPLTQAF